MFIYFWGMQLPVGYLLRTSGVEPRSDLTDCVSKCPCKRKRKIERLSSVSQSRLKVGVYLQLLPNC